MAREEALAHDARRLVTMERLSILAVAALPVSPNHWMRPAKTDDAALFRS